MQEKSKSSFELFSPVKMELWAGYAFGWPGCMGNYYEYTRGCVTTPRYIEKLQKEKKSSGCDRKTILDNGAFPAWRDGKHISYKETANTLIHCILQFQPEWVIAPDVIGDSNETRYRSMRFASEIRAYSSETKILFAIQEGFNIETFKETEPIFDGFFIGGRDREFKFKILSKYRNLTEKWMHVARISREKHMRVAALLGANSFDTTTFSRGQKTNRETDYLPRIERYCSKHEKK